MVLCLGLPWFWPMCMWRRDYLRRQFVLLRDTRVPFYNFIIMEMGNKP